jgi:hypothetical protein
MRATIRARALLPLLALAFAGCSEPAATVSGEVTYDGQPVKKGYVTFAPADGKGPAVGAEIADGRYAAEKVPPGPKVVKVEASSGPGPSVQSSADAAKLSKEWKGKLGPDGIIRTETVPDSAEGNNQKYDAKAGAQTLDLHLKKPAGQK